MGSIGQTYNIVLIKHIGESDKPLPTLIIYFKDICNSKCVQSILSLNKADFFLKRVITDVDLTDIFSDVLEDSVLIESKEKLYPFGSYKITFYQSKDCNNQSVFIRGRKKSIDFFNSVIEKVEERKSEKNNELIISLENIIKRINY